MIENVEKKSFVEIWDGLTSDERGELARRILLARCCATYQTVWNWGRAKSRPAVGIVRDKVSTTTATFLGIKTDSKTLFPQS